MAYKRILPDKPYLPIKGWNPDNNTLHIDEEETPDILNLRISRGEIATRAGYRMLGNNIPTTDPILAYYAHQVPNKAEALFAFTKDQVYKFNPSANLWQHGMHHVLLEDCEATTGWTAGTDSSIAAATPFYYGSKGLQLTTPLLTKADGTVLVYKDWGGGASRKDLSAYTNFIFYYINTGTVDIKVKVNFYSDGGTTQVGTGYACTLTRTSIFHPISLALITPALYNTIQRVSITLDTEQVCAASVVTMDYFCAVLKGTITVTDWSITPFVDTTHGASAVAAGSSPPIPGALENDGDNRYLLYYDKTAEYFKTLVLYTEEPFTDENTGLTGGAAGATVDGTGTANDLDNVDGSTKFLVAGTAEFYAEEYGTLAVASAVADSSDTDKYALIPVDPELVEMGTSSYVGEDGKWKIKFKLGTVSGQKIYVKYTAKISASFQPRYVYNFANRLLLCSVFDSTSGVDQYFPWRVMWTNVADMTTTNTESYADLIENDISPILGAEYQGTDLIIYKAKSIVKASSNQDVTFAFFTVWKNGVLAGRSIQNYNGMHFFLGEDDIYMWDGAQAKSITISRTSGQYRVREQMLKNFNRTYLNKVFSMFYPKYNEYWLWLPLTGNPTKVFVYNVQYDCWYWFEYSAKTCAGVFNKTGSVVYSSLVGTFADQGWTFNDSSMSSLNLYQLFGDENGFTWLLDEYSTTDGMYTLADLTNVSGTTVSTRLITRDFLFNDSTKHERVQKVEVFAKGAGTLSIGYNCELANESTSFTGTSNLTLSLTQKRSYYYPDVVCERIRFILSATSAYTLYFIEPFAVKMQRENL